MSMSAAAVTIAALKKPFDDIYSSATGQVKILLKKWTIAGEIDQVAQKISEVEMVPSMFRSEPTPLTSFYYPSRITQYINGEHRPVQVDKLDEIRSTGNILITGTVGQGKSIFMRYLCIRELSEGKRIPIFLELRGIDAETTLKNLIVNSLNLIGINEINDEAYDFLLKKGIFVFFLDGFDEVKREYAPLLRKDLFRMMTKYSSTRIIISSRPGSTISLITSAPSIHRVALSNLQKDDFRPFLKKLGQEDTHLDKLLAAIESSPTDIQDVLNTPLMFTLLNEAFGSSANIPDTLHYFYESMFTVLVLRHDLLKPAFIRQRRAPLNNLQLQQAFEAFSYLSKDLGVSVTDDQFSQCALEVSELTDLEFEPESLKSDFTEAVCLMMPDGLKTAFIHKSIQEFFAAFFISHLKDDDFVKEIYESFKGAKITAWAQEISFLEKTDNLRYVKYFRIPTDQAFLRNAGFNPKTSVKVSKENFKRFIDSLGCIVFKGEDAEETFVLMNHESPAFNFASLEAIQAFDIGLVSVFTKSDIKAIQGLNNIIHTTLWNHIKNNNPELFLKNFRDRCVFTNEEIIRNQAKLEKWRLSSRATLVKRKLKPSNK